MNRNHGADTLSVELVSLIFDYLLLGDLVTASHVLKYWRTVACQHPTYWRDVTLAAASNPAIHLFHARLVAGSSRSVSIRIYVPRLEFPSDERSTVLSTIRRNLYRIDGLYIELDIACDRELFVTLQNSAPRLHTLDLCLLDDAKSSNLLPKGLFLRQAPKLRYVRLVNIQLSADRLPSVFVPITELYYCFGEALSFPTALFTHSRALETLVIYGASCSLETAEDEDCTLTAERLQHVHVSVFQGSTDLMRRLPCSSIADISIPVNDKQSAQLLLGHLRGPLELGMQLQPDASHLYLRYRSQDTGMQRTFLCAPAQVAEAYLPEAYVAEDVLSRVVVLHATTSCVPLLPAFSNLDACTRVALSLAEGARLEHPPRALCIPKLARIDIASLTPQSMTSGDLIGFLDAAFTTGTEQVQVALAGVTLEDDLAAIRQDRFIISPNIFA